MTTEEFSNQFDTMLSSYLNSPQFGELASKADIVFDEYEKSIFLTQAQDIILRQYFYRTLNPEGQGMDDSEVRQLDYSSLITVANVNKAVGTPYDTRGILYKLPDDILIMLNEKLEADNKCIAVVIPVHYKDYDRMMSQSYTQPLKRQAWRLYQNNKATMSEIIPNEHIDSKSSTYKIRYIRRPVPIVLHNFTGEGISVYGRTEVTQCELDPVIHLDILDKAIQLALSSRGIRTTNAEQK